MSLLPGLRVHPFVPMAGAMGYPISPLPRLNPTPRFGLAAAAAASHGSPRCQPWEPGPHPGGAPEGATQATHLFPRLAPWATLKELKQLEETLKQKMPQKP